MLPPGAGILTNNKGTVRVQNGAVTAGRHNTLDDCGVASPGSTPGSRPNSRLMGGGIAVAANRIPGSRAPATRIFDIRGVGTPADADPASLALARPRLLRRSAVSDEAPVEPARDHTSRKSTLGRASSISGPNRLGGASRKRKARQSSSHDTCSSPVARPHRHHAAVDCDRNPRIREYEGSRRIAKMLAITTEQEARVAELAQQVGVVDLVA